ncbi:MAG: hypothetical protein ABEJ56_00695 [Candidatus Nanohaloarchaea archaeon]
MSVSKPDLDILDNRHFKWELDRTYPNLVPIENKSFEAEWEWLNVLHEEMPDHVVEPLNPMFLEGELTGYSMNKVSGRRIDSYFNMPDFGLTTGVERVIRLFDLVEKMHEKGLAHGDLYKNIIYSDQEGFKMIDPPGHPSDMEEIEALQDRDKAAVIHFQSLVSRNPEWYDNSDPWSQLSSYRVEYGELEKV